ncbi:MAG: electron transport complex subunit RsxC [Phycisphaerae bacterium]
MSAPGSATFPRGVHPPERKDLAEDRAIEVLPVPKQVTIPLVQHLGAPAEPLVKPKQAVALGEKIGQAGGFISAAVHATVAGVVGRPTAVTLPNGRHVPAVPIAAADEQPLAGDALRQDTFGGHWPVDVEGYGPKQIAEAVSEAGIVGLGGAAFPTHVKLIRNDKKPIDTLLVNGCECEPYLTADYRLMVEHPEPIVTGALLAGRANGVERIVVVIEDNKPEAVEAVRAVAGPAGVEVAVVKTKYPQGGEKQAVLAITGREVPTLGLPLDIGVVVVNVGTAAAIARAVVRGRPLTHRVVSVTGAGVAEPKNLLVPIGASYRELIDYCGGLTPDAARVIAGGPMMGFTLGDLDVPVTKGTSGVTVLTHRDIRRGPETTCLRCGQCVDACPLNLVASKLAQAARGGDWDLARRYHILACMECGCCAYACPASLPLVQLIRMGKAQMPRE